MTKWLNHAVTWFFKIDKKCFTCRVKHILSTVYAEISHSLHMVNGNGNMRQLPNNLWKLWITSQLYLYRIIATP